MRSISETKKNQAFLIALRERREKMRIPQKVLAYELGISTVAYSYIERGSTDLKLDIFKFLCKRLNLKAENFLI